VDALASTDVAALARLLLGRLVHGHGVTIRLTEVEAYAGPADPASHAFTRTPRSKIMYGAPGRLYVYRSYGLHHCANVVIGPEGHASAVLLRAGQVVEGHSLARQRRALQGDDDRLARGPGNLASALGLSLVDNGTDLTDTTADPRLGPEVRTVPRGEIEIGPRVGVSKAADVLWRWWLAGDPTVSAYRRSPRADPAGLVR